MYPKFLLKTAFSTMVEGKNEEMSTSELSGGARIHYIFQSIFVKSLEVWILWYLLHFIWLRVYMVEFLWHFLICGIVYKITSMPYFCILSNKFELYCSILSMIFMPSFSPKDYSIMYCNFSHITYKIAVLPFNLCAIIV